MSDAHELIQNAKDIRARLRRPPNAVFDPGIDLARYRREAIEAAQKKAKALSARVTILECAQSKKIRVEMVMSAACTHFGIGMADLRSPSRLKDMVYFRHVAVHVAYKHCLSKIISGMAISRHFQKDHTTLLHARDKMKIVVDNSGPDSRVWRDIAAIEDAIIRENFS